MGAELVVVLALHVAFLGANACLHGVAAWLAISNAWRGYHLCVVLLSVTAIVLAVFMLAGVSGGFTLHRGVSYGFQFVAYAVAWAWPAVLSIRGRSVVEEMKTAVQQIKDTLV